MTKRALIIGSQTLGLTGVHNDVETISARLRRRGFELDVRIEDQASREGILAGLARLIHDSRANDAALIYYAGHGGRVVNPRHGPERRREPPLLHCLVPTDWSEARFRGLLDLELSLHLAELTAATRNVAVILDCCHAARMWRGSGDDAVPRALDRVCVGDIDEQLACLRERDLSRLHAESNPDAVRLVATEADRSAFETTLQIDGRRERSGLMTTMLARVLDELGDARVSWRTLGLLVRERVMQHYDFQRPEIEGPGQRYLFELDTAGYGGSVAYFLDEGRPALRACRLLGAGPGARYAIMPAGVTEYDEDQTVAEATVTRLLGTAAHVDLDLRDAMAEPSVGALAFPLELPLGKQLIRVEGQGPSADAMRELISASAFVDVAGDDDAALLSVEVGERIELLADSGAALAFPDQNIGSGRRRLLTDLERWAQAETLRNLPDGELDCAYAIEWGRVVDGEQVPMNDGEAVHVGDRIYVTFANRSTTPLLFTVFNVGVDGSVTLLTAAEPSGTRVEPGQSYVLGLDRGQDGLMVHWPESVPDHAALPESLIAIVSEGRHDFAAFEIAGRKTRSMARGPGTALERALDQIGAATTRNVTAEDRTGAARYAVSRHDFVAEPQPRVSFAVEQPASRGLVERAIEQRGAPDSRELSIRLTELFVHENRALGGRSDIRVDTLCLTGGAEPSTATYHFPGVADEDRLPLDNILIFHGRALSFVDFAIWVSKDDDGTPELPELLRQITLEPAFSRATSALASLAKAGPQAASIATALAAGGTVTYLVNELFKAAVGTHIGLYRTSFLSLENWGIGPHPKQGALRAQDFSFRYEVVGR